MVVRFYTVNEKTGVTPIGVLKNIKDIHYKSHKAGVRLVVHKRFELPMVKKRYTFPTEGDTYYPTYAFSPSILVIEDALIHGDNATLAFHGDLHGRTHTEISESIRTNRNLEFFNEILQERVKQLEGNINEMFSNVEEFYKNRAKFFAETKQTLFGGGERRWDDFGGGGWGRGNEDFMEPMEEEPVGLKDKMLARIGR